MFEENVEQYLDAKKMAAKRLLGKEVKFLPSNGEISDELHRIAKFHHADTHQQTLFEMRLVALDVLDHLAPFNPRLIGSVSTGRIRQGSDIDIHVFTDQLEEIFIYLDELDWDYETKHIEIWKDNRLREYTHIYIHHDFPVELSVYPSNDIRVTGRSSTDGKRIDRLSLHRLRTLIESEHPAEWAHYLDVG
ncbi:nucleotidyltransferase [Hahella sp. CCB-MM4]|uniref:nucleotidyltransferase n=1 Tax=Hahella sp. (strain CCB-MM4) TaxID=1926491 RepID=UPI001FEF78E2|nr:nucleotidyltransferase [Hahella sp. CCB-MM4]